jgi:hypothetical protein
MASNPRQITIDGGQITPSPRDHHRGEWHVIDSRAARIAGKTGQPRLITGECG